MFSSYCWLSCNKPFYLYRYLGVGVHGQGVNLGVGLGVGLVVRSPPLTSLDS